MICTETVEKYCSEDISQIENYSLAITDMDNIWDCHHRLEIGTNGERISEAKKAYWAKRKMASV